MRSVLFLCHGNICRSPMAEFVFKQIAEGYPIQIESMAVSSEEIGNPIYPPAAAELRKRNVPFGNHRARKMTKDDYKRFDHIIIMEKYNLSLLKRIIGEDDENKVNLLLDFTNMRGEDIEDPWYSGNFSKVFEQISDGCRGLLEFMKENGEV